jgi:hypothetical protein
MSIQGKGSTFYPLYWCFHDNWKYYTAASNGHGGFTTKDYDHFGHLHFFMMGFNTSLGRDAWFGQQTYKFSVEDIWGPRSKDPNQQHQYRVVGTPKWLFHLEELWRRVYIQSWDEKIDTNNLAERRGVKWDACASDKRHGPFREGRVGDTSYAPVYIRDARTVPIDYYLNETQQQVTTESEGGGPHRTNHLGELAAGVMSAEWPYPEPDPIPPNYSHYNPATFNPATYSLEHGNYLYGGGDMSLTVDSAAVPPFSDRFHIWPIIEYQRVTQLNWERYPGWEAAHDVSSNTFGDGWSVAINAPFVDTATGLYRSPFCPPGSKDVRPIGEYFNGLVPLERQPKFAEVEYKDPYQPPPDPLPVPYKPYYYSRWEQLPPQLSGQPMVWQNPYGDKADGKWVQQFLGAIVQAKCVVTIEHKLGGRRDVWVHGTQLIPATSFAGRDQMQGVAE